MINVISGRKGSGKTKRIIDAANAALEGTKGYVVFVTDTNDYMYSVNRNIKFINVKDYKIAGEEALCGFIRGLIAGNRDIEDIFIDGCARITGKPLSEMAAFFYMLDKVSEDCGMKITLTCSAATEELPSFVAKYL